MSDGAWSAVKASTGVDFRDILDEVHKPLMDPREMFITLHPRVWRWMECYRMSRRQFRRNRWKFKRGRA